MNHRLEMRGVSKRFGAVRAIREADLVVEPGSVHALVGENGAGKSTLISVISGATRPDTGTVALDGELVELRDTATAIAHGVVTVYQDPQLFAELSVIENVFLGRELTTGPRIDWPAQHARVLELLELIGLPASVASRPVGELSVVQRQQVSIMKALVGEARVLILDEPSAILTDAEIRVLFAVIARLTATGVAVVYISHRLDELFEIADTVTVMRDGVTIGTHAIGDLTVRGVAELMVGGALDVEGQRREASPGRPVLELDGLSSEGVLDDVDLVVRAGEIVGLYGLVGSGVAEVADCVYGIRPVTDGEIRIDGEPVVPRSPRAMRDRGVALLPGDRKGQGMFGFQSIAFNISVGNLDLLSRARTWVDRSRERAVALELVSRLGVRTPDERQRIDALSGGNAQKVMLARLLVERPSLLVLVEPTQGVDVGAKQEIHRIVTGLAEQGTAVLVVTSDLGEALRISDRLHVVRAGTLTRRFGPGAAQVDVLAAAAGEEAA